MRVRSHLTLRRQRRVAQRPKYWPRGGHCLREALPISQLNTMGLKGSDFQVSLQEEHSLPARTSSKAYSGNFLSVCNYHTSSNSKMHKFKNHP